MKVVKKELVNDDEVSDKFCDCCELDLISLNYRQVYILLTLEADTRRPGGSEIPSSQKKLLKALE